MEGDVGGESNPLSASSKTIVTGQDGIQSLALGSLHVYWVTSDLTTGAGHLASVAKTGGAVAVIAPKINGAIALGINSTTFYWTAVTTTAEIFSLPKTSAGAAPKRFAPTWNGGGTGAAGYILADDSQVYVQDGSNDLYFIPINTQVPVSHGSAANHSSLSLDTSDVFQTSCRNPLGWISELAKTSSKATTLNNQNCVWSTLAIGTELYWTDANEGKIKRAALHGAGNPMGPIQVVATFPFSQSGTDAVQWLAATHSHLCVSTANGDLWCKPLASGNPTKLFSGKVNPNVPILGDSANIYWVTADGTSITSTTLN
jgi:hypothetical protein